MPDDNRTPEELPSRPAAEQRTLAGLLGDLARDVPQLIRQELQLLRAEAARALANADAALVWLLLGALFGIGGLVLLLQAAAQALTRWLDPTAAEAVVGGLALLLGMAAVQAGRRRLRAAGRLPERTARQLRQDATLIRDHTP